MRATTVRQAAVMSVFAGLIGGCANAYGEGALSCEQIELRDLGQSAPRTVEFILDSAAARHATTLDVAVDAGEPGRMAVELSGPETMMRGDGPVSGHRCEVSGAGLAGEWQLRIASEAPTRVMIYDHTGRLIAQSAEIQTGAPSATLSWSGPR